MKTGKSVEAWYDKDGLVGLQIKKKDKVVDCSGLSEQEKREFIDLFKHGYEFFSKHIND